MPTLTDYNEALEANCHRIADLANERQLLVAQFDVDVAACSSIEQMLQLAGMLSERTTVVDAEIELLSEGSRKLMAQIEAVR